MDRYQKVQKPKPELPINENEIRITSQGLVRNYISYATSLLQERAGREIVLKAMGQAISKTVSIAEFVKRRVPRLHQDTAISSVSIVDTWEPLEEGLLPVEQTRHVSMISITLSTKELNKNSPGYQAPYYVEQPRSQKKYQQQLQPSQPRDAVTEDSYGQGGGRGQTQGHGRGRGRAWSRGGYGNYQENDGYQSWGQGGGAANGEYQNRPRGGRQENGGYQNRYRGGRGENGGYQNRGRGGRVEYDGYQNSGRRGEYDGYQYSGRRGEYDGYQNSSRGGGRGGGYGYYDAPQYGRGRGGGGRGYGGGRGRGRGRMGPRQADGGN